MDFRVRQLECFLTLSGMLNYGEASRLLYITQPTLSSQIKSLEEVFGARLFDRDSQHVSLTTAGTILVDHARTILQQIKEAHQEIHVNARKWRTRIACREEAYVGLLPRLLRSLEQRHPQFIVEITDIGEEEHLAALLERRVDAVLMSEPHHTRDVRFEELVTEPIVAAVPRGFQVANQSTASLAELTRYPILGPLSSSMEAAVAACNLEVRYFAKHRRPGSQLAEVEAGHAVAFCPKLFCSVRRPNVKFISIRDVIPSAIFGVTTRDGDESPSTAVLLSTLRALALPANRIACRS